jgi:hypothetical protein
MKSRFSPTQHRNAVDCIPVETVKQHTADMQCCDSLAAVKQHTADMQRYDSLVTVKQHTADMQRYIPFVSAFCLSFEGEFAQHFGVYHLSKLAPSF